MNEKGLTQGNILGALLKFAVPVLFALFLQAMYGAADLIIVGKFAEVADQSGVATGSMFINIPTMTITSLAMGVTVYIANAIGAGDKKRAGKGIGNAICLFAAAAVLMTVIIVPNSDRLAILMDAPKESFKQTSDYIKICGAGIVFIIAYNVLGAIFRGIGDSKTPLLTVAAACVINILCDIIFVDGFHMGASGAALATIMAQAVSVVFSFVIIRKKELPFDFERKMIKFEPKVTGKILWVGIPIALQEILVSFSFLFIQVLVNSMGVVYSAAIGVGEKVCAFLMLVGSAYMQSMAAFVAQNNGAGLHNRSKKALLYGMMSAFAAGMCTAALSFFFGDRLAGLFSNDMGVIMAAHSYLKAYSIDCLLTAIFFCFVGYFNGCEKSIFVMMQGLIGAFCVRIPIAYLMSRLADATLFDIGLATPASSAVQVVMCVIAYFYFERKLKRDIL